MAAHKPHNIESTSLGFCLVTVGARQLYFVLPAPSSPTWEVERGPEWVKNPDNIHEFTVTGAIESSTDELGQTWTYGHEENGATMTSMTAPDGTFTEFTYVTDDVPAKGKLQSTVVYEDSGKTQELSRVGYTYDDQVRLDTVTTNQKLQVKYDYDDEDNTITITERSYTSPTTVFGRTVYHYYQYGQYGDGQPSYNQTFVTRKDESNPNKDQTTVYGFYMNDDGQGDIRYVWGPVQDWEDWDHMTEYLQYDDLHRILLQKDPSGLKTKNEYYPDGERPLKKVTVFRSEDNIPENGTIYSTEEYTGRTIQPLGKRSTRTHGAIGRTIGGTWRSSGRFRP